MPLLITDSHPTEENTPTQEIEIDLQVDTPEYVAQRVTRAHDFQPNSQSQRDLRYGLSIPGLRTSMRGHVQLYKDL